MQTVVITGVNGFIGSNLARKLCTKFKVIGIEMPHSGLERIAGLPVDIYTPEPDKLDELFTKHRVSGIIHTATLYGRQGEDVKKMVDSNFIMPFTLLEKALQNGVSFFLNTDTALDRLTSAYSLTKKQFADWLVFYSGKIKAGNLQLEHFYGPGCNSTNFITLMIEKMLRGEKKIDLTAGIQKRDFVYFEDVLKAYDVIIEYLNNSGTQNGYYEFEAGSPEVWTLKEIVLYIKEITGSATELNFGAVPYRENEVMESHSNTDSLQQLGWQPMVPLREGLRITINQEKVRILNI
ncbi:MAG: NAD-dependent epimerase/dehydratase family protein [Ignavibacteria bacterium]|nr:NAD-dependent epimerase/dehydratase family protein [Ignavibacteria bacterium]